MAFAIIPLVALLASLLTLFTGFGLGTLLLPAFAAFFPLPAAIAMTAVVHLASNLSKLAIVGRQASWPVVLKFGLPAVLGALAGGLLLSSLGHTGVLHAYMLVGREFKVTWTGLVVGITVAIFGLFDLLPRGERLALRPRWYPLGGLVSGFFGGLSGHQGALRAAFLIRSGLSAGAFVATGAVIASLVDVTRLGTYWGHFQHEQTRAQWPLMLAACVAAFLGAFLGAKLVKKVTLPALKVVVAIGLVLFGLAMASGVV